MIILLFATVLGGAAGGYASYLLANLSNQESNSATSVNYPPWLINLFLGIVAAFVVSLFLSLAQSKVIDYILGNNIAESRTSLLIYIGFCLLAAASYRKFIPAVSGQALAIIRNEVQQNKQKIDQLEEVTENTGLDNEFDATKSFSEQTEVDSKESVSLALSEAERRVLSSFQDARFSRRTVSGIMKDAGLLRINALQTLANLMQKGLIRDRISKKTGNTLYEITPRGVAAASFKQT